jgi:hypothetical protein
MDILQITMSKAWPGLRCAACLGKAAITSLTDKHNKGQFNWPGWGMAKQVDHGIAVLF